MLVSSGGSQQITSSHITCKLFMNKNNTNNNHWLCQHYYSADQDSIKSHSQQVGCCGSLRSGHKGRQLFSFSGLLIKDHKRRRNSTHCRHYGTAGMIIPRAACVQNHTHGYKLVPGVHCHSITSQVRNTHQLTLEPTK